MKHVALVTCSTFPALSQSDKLLVEPLKNEGFVPHVTPWDKKDIDWGLFDAVVLRSTWNYQYHYEAFLLWLSKLQKIRTRVWNPLSLIRWNIQKSYLLDLEKKGIPIIPTIVRAKDSGKNLLDITSGAGWHDIVVKPVVGAAAYGVTRLKQTDYSESKRNIEALITKNDCLIQPFAQEVITEGEYSLVFIGNSFSHAVLKKPKRGEFRSNYEYGSKENLINPEKSLLRQASNVIKILNTDVLYARVDGVNRNGIFMLMELELIEPHLFFDLKPEAARTFVRVLKNHL